MYCTVVLRQKIMHAAALLLYLLCWLYDIIPLPPAVTIAVAGVVEDPCKDIHRGCEKCGKIRIPGTTRTATAYTACHIGWRLRRDGESKTCGTCKFCTLTAVGFCWTVLCSEGVGVHVLELCQNVGSWTSLLWYPLLSAVTSLACQLLMNRPPCCACLIADCAPGMALNGTGDDNSNWCAPCPQVRLPTQHIILHYIALHYITLHYITLHYITLHYITLHYIRCSTQTRVGTQSGAKRKAHRGLHCSVLQPQASLTAAQHQAPARPTVATAITHYVAHHNTCKVHVSAVSMSA
jgi:hypothetical protein